jgi:hypothetical protein
MFSRYEKPLLHRFVQAPTTSEGFIMPFNFEEYRAQCASYADSALQKEFEKYCRMLASSSSSAGICLGLAPFTGGLSLIGGASGCASMYNSIEKLEIIEIEMKSRGKDVHYRKRDLFGGYLFGIGCGAVSHGAAGGLLDNAAHHAASAGHLALAHVLKTTEHAANGLATDGGKALEKRCYGEAVAIQKQYGDGEQPRIRVAYFQPNL